MIATSYLGRISGTKKIEITKEKTDKEIPINILRDAKSSTNNVETIVNEISNTGINFTIIDKNEILYEYANKYEITKEVKNENYIVNVKKLDWSNLYGELETGKYNLKLSGENCVTLNINFEILENGEIEIGNLEIFS